MPWFSALKPVYHQFDWPAQDYNNVGIYTGCGPESFGSWYPVTNAWGGLYFVVVYEAKEYGYGFAALGSLELTISIGIVMVLNFPTYNSEGLIRTLIFGGYKVVTLLIVSAFTGLDPYSITYILISLILVLMTAKYIELTRVLLLNGVVL